MSKAVLNNSQAIGHTDLLSGILKVQVRNEEKITEQDRIYCQNQQDELYKTLDQIAWWYNIFKREADKYEGKIKLKHAPNGKITVSSYELHYRYNNDEKDYTHICGIKASITITLSSNVISLCLVDSSNHLLEGRRN